MSTFALSKQDEEGVFLPARLLSQIYIKKMNYPTKKIFDQACDLYASICANPDDSALVTSLNNLLQEYDFENEVFSENGKQGVALCSGEVIIPAEYHKIKVVTRFSLPKEEILAVGVDGEGIEYLINHKGEVVFDADEINPGLGFVPFAFRMGDKWGVGSDNGRIIIPPVMDKIEWGGNGYVFFKQDGKYGLRTPFGEMVVPKFDSIEFDKDEYLSVVYKGNKGYLDEDCTFTPDKSEAYYNYDTIFSCD